MQGFYKLLNGGKVKNVDEFEQRHTAVVPLLQEWGIEIEECGLSDADKDTEAFKDQFSQLNSWHNGQKPLVSIEHDVFLAEMIRRRRGSVDETAAGVKYWVLTYDRRLVKYSVYYATPDQLPFCMVADDWLQIARPFLPRTDNYQNAFVTLLDNPILYPSDHTVPFDHMVEALHRLERYEELPMPVVASMMASAEVTRKFRTAQSTDEERRLLEVAAAEAARSAMEENEALKGSIAELSSQTTRLEERLEAFGGDLRQASADRDVAEQRASMLQAKLAQEQESAQQQRLAVESASAAVPNGSGDDKTRSVDQQLTRLRWIVYGLASSFGLFEIKRVLSEIWPDLGGLQRSVWAGSTVLVLIGLLMIPLGIRGWRVLLATMTVLGTVGFLYQLWILGS